MGFCIFDNELKGSYARILVHTDYYNSNLIWRTVSRRVDEVIPSRSLDGDPMV